MTTDAARMPTDATSLDTEFKRGLGLFDATMVVVGSMIGSGIFIVSADIARLVGSPVWLLAAWLITGLLTLAAALSYGELAAMMPRAGGQYVYLREAFSPLWGFLYGWTLFLVIQTGTIAAVGVAFARFLGVLWPTVAEDHYLIAPVHLSTGYALSLSTAQVIAVALIALLTWTNTRGIDYGRIVQNVFTVAKTGALIALIGVGLLLGWNAEAVAANFGDLVDAPRATSTSRPGLSAATAFGLFVGLCVAQTGSLFSSDAWNNITFTAGEVKDPRRNLPLALALGTGLVTALVPAGQRRLPGDAAAGGHPAGAGRPRRHSDAGHDRAGSGCDVDGCGDPDLDLRLQQRPHPGRRTGVLRHGPRRPVLQAGRPTQPGEGPGGGTGAPGRVVCAAGAAANLRPGNGPLRQPVRQPARLRDLGGADLLHPDHRRHLPAAGDATRCRTALSRRGLPAGPRALHRGRATILLVLFAYRWSTTWPGLAIVLLGVPVYYGWRKN